MLSLSRMVVIGVLSGGLAGLISCHDQEAIPTTTADEMEHSTNPTRFLVGTYQLEKLNLPSGYGEQRPNLTSTYSVEALALGQDSLLLTLTGTGKAGGYNHLPLGTFVVNPSVNNLTSVSIGSNYVYELRRATGSKAYITFSRVPFSDKTEYAVLFDLFRIGYALDKAKGAVIADESYSINPSYNERVATLRLTRTSSGVWLGGTN